MPSLEARPASLACLQCRRSHLRCIGAAPTCQRCLSRGLTCTYTPSRRGHRRGPGKRKTTDPESANSEPSPTSYSEPSQWLPTHDPNLDPPAATATSSKNPPPAIDTQPVLPPLLQNIAVQQNVSAPWIDDEHLANLYYLNFHSSHPILLPRKLYWRHAYPRCLKAVVELIGAHFSPTAPRDALRQAAERELENGQQNTPHMVQARILYAITLLARNEIQASHQVLTQAIEAALQLGMHRREFAVEHANHHRVEEESMRRTWYELYVTDGCLAAFQRRPSFKTNTVGANVLLPSDDSIYDDEVCLLNPASREDYQSSIFSDDDVTFSSFCYRIEAVRLLGRVLSITGSHGVHRDQVQAADNALAAFLHHLPPSKRESEILNTYGELDELMFQAHMVVQYATILLHFPRGDLAPPVPSTTDVPGGTCAKFLCPCTRQHVHSIKAIDASKTLSMLAAFRAPVQRHSPFFVYPLALAAVVQLSISAIHVRSSRRCLEQHRDRVELILGVLKTLRQYWPITSVILRVLNKMALAVFQPWRDEHSAAMRLEQPLDASIDSCSYAIPTNGSPAIDSQWLDNFDLQDIQGIIGLDTDGFCL